MVHAGLTMYGHRDLALLYPAGEIEILAQTPGKYYMGHLCAIKREVRHHDPVDQKLLSRLEIVVTFRIDCFRGHRAQKLECKPTPPHIYDAVNDVVVSALARYQFYLPTYSEVVAAVPAVPAIELPASKKRKS